jgi:uncharacterized RDD family membrane protein YckC
MKALLPSMSWNHSRTMSIDHYRYGHDDEHRDDKSNNNNNRWWYEYSSKWQRRWQRQWRWQTSLPWFTTATAIAGASALPLINSSFMIITPSSIPLHVLSSTSLPSSPTMSATTSISPSSYPSTASLGRRVSLLTRLIAVMIDGLFIGAIAGVIASGILSFIGIAAAGAGGWTATSFIIRPFYYWISLVITNGQSLGRSAMGIRVRRADRKPMDWIVAGKRTAATALIGLDWAWSLVDRNQRCLHDIAAGTVVVEDQPSWKVL